MSEKFDFRAASEARYEQYFTEIWEAADGTQYRGLDGHFTVVEWGWAGRPMLAYAPEPGNVLEDASKAVGHLKEAMAAGFELVCLNLRPGVHHVRRKANIS
jgi:hypothetical protein